MKTDDLQKKMPDSGAPGNPALATAEGGHHSPHWEELNALSVSFMVRKLRAEGAKNLPDFKTVDEAIAWMEEHKPPYRRQGEAKSGNKDDLAISSSEARQIADKLRSFGFKDVPLFRTVDDFFLWGDKLRREQEEQEKLTKHILELVWCKLRSFGYKDVPCFKTMEEVDAWFAEHPARPDDGHDKK